LPCLFLKAPPAAEWQPVNRITCFGREDGRNKGEFNRWSNRLSKSLSVTPCRGEENGPGGWKTEPPDSQRTNFLEKMLAGDRGAAQRRAQEQAS
jgi:hypothetical protein